MDEAEFPSAVMGTHELLVDLSLLLPNEAERELVRDYKVELYE